MRLLIENSDAGDHQQVGMERQSVDDVSKAFPGAEADAGFLRLLLDNVSAPITYLDHKLIYRECNAEAARHLARARDEIIGRHLHDVVPDNPTIWSAVENVLSTGEAFEEIIRFVWADRPELGERVYRVAYRPHLDDAGKVVGCFTEGEDLTELTRAQEAVESELSATYEALPDGLITHGLNGEVVRMNAAAKRLQGYSDHDRSLSLLARAPTMRVQWDNGDPVTDLDALPPARALRGETVRGVVLSWVPYSDNSRHWFSVSAAPVLSAEGRILGAVSAFTDITERQGLLDQAEERAAELGAVLNSIADGVVVYGTGGQIRRMNQTAHRLLAYSGRQRAESLEARMASTQVRRADGTIYDPQDVPAARALAGETVQAEVMGITRPSGQATTWVTASAAPILTSSGRVVGAVATFSDVTGLLTTQHWLTEAQAKLEDQAGQLEEQAMELEEQAAELQAQNDELHKLTDHLALEHEQLVMILESLGEGFFSLDRTWRLTYVNSVAEQLLGWRRETLLGQSLQQVVPDGRYFIDLQQAMSAGTPTTFEVHVESPAGWVEVRAYPSAGGLAVFFRDVTKRKAVEAERERLLERQRFLVVLGEGLRSLQDPASIMNVAAEMLGRHLKVNRVAYAEVDVAADTINMRDWTDGSVVSALGLHRVRDWGPELCTAYGRGEVWRVDDVTTDPRQGVRDYATAYAALDIRAAVGVPLVRGGAWVAVLYMATNQPRAWTDAETALIQDVAEHTWEAVERGRAEQALRRHATELETLNTANQLLLREVNHRVKNNLTAILGLIFAEQRRLAGGSPRHGELPRCQAALTDLGERVRSLATAHGLLSAGGWRPLRLDDLVKEVVGAVAPVIENSDEAILTTEGQPVYVTPEQAHHLALVVGELVTNTVKYAGGPESLRVWVDTGVEDGFVRLIYRDRGPGYPESVLGGSGRSVGLGLVDTVVAISLRGTWRVRNEGGAVTEIRFPAAKMTRGNADE